MARRGRFGRAPRSQPNVTSTLIALAREAQNRRTQNMMDAWEKGGLFEGAPVTDDMVVGYWKNLLKGVSKNDPLYETYSNTAMRYEYAIAESKAATAYSQGKLSPSGMAKFYLDWAKKVPKDSEFYRELQRDAAQYMRTASHSGAASGTAVKNADYDVAKSKIKSENEAAGDYLTSVLENIIRTQRPTGESASTTENVFQQADPTFILNALSSMRVSYDESGDGGGSSEVLYHDPMDGHAVTAYEVEQTLRGLDPDFTGTVTMSYYQDKLRQKIEGAKLRMQLAESHGKKKDDVSAARKDIVTTSQIGLYAGEWEAEQHYLDLHDVWLDVWQDPTTSVKQKTTAWEQYAGNIVKDLLNNPNVQLSDSMRVSLLAELQGDGSIDSVAESLLGTNDSEHDTTQGTKVKTGDIADTWADLEAYNEQERQVEAGEAYWTMGDMRDGVFTPNPAGLSIGASTIPPSPNAMTIALPQGDGLPPITVTVEPRKITASVVDVNGNTVAPTNPNAAVVGTFVDVVWNGVPTRMYRRTDPDTGAPYYTTEFTAAPNVQVSEDSNGNMTATVVVPYDLSTPAGQSAALASGQFTIKGDKLVVNPAAAVEDPIRAAVDGLDPYTEFESPNVALVRNDPENAHSIVGSRQFQNALRLEAGMVFGNDGWVPADPTKAVETDSKLQALQLAAVQQVPVFDEAIRNGLWDRTTRKSRNLTPLSTDERQVAIRDARTSRGETDTRAEAISQYRGSQQIMIPAANPFYKPSTDKASAVPSIVIPQMPNPTVPTFGGRTGPGTVAPTSVPTTADILNMYRPQNLGTKGTILERGELR